MNREKEAALDVEGNMEEDVKMEVEKDYKGSRQKDDRLTKQLIWRLKRNNNICRSGPCGGEQKQETSGAGKGKSLKSFNVENESIKAVKERQFSVAFWMD